MRLGVYRIDTRVRSPCAPILRWVFQKHREQRFADGQASVLLNPFERLCRRSRQRPLRGPTDGAGFLGPVGATDMGPAGLLSLKPPGIGRKGLTVEDGRAEGGFFFGRGKHVQPPWISGQGQGGSRQHGTDVQ
jgi:hypothetical protein